jgi:hypothetical protein
MAPSVERYGIFRKFPDGSCLWLRAERDFNTAMQTMRDLARADGMEYYLFDFREGLMIPMPRETGDTPPSE